MRKGGKKNWMGATVHVQMSEELCDMVGAEMTAENDFVENQNTIAERLEALI